MTIVLCLLAFIAGGLTSTWAWAFLVLARSSASKAGG